jgi:hypothetical protein
MKVELVIRYVGKGLNCNSCGRRRESTLYQLRNTRTEELLEEFQLCDQCQDRGFSIGFNTSFKDPKDYLAARRNKLSAVMEHQLARDVRGKRQPGSGNQDEKADVRVMGDWRIEHKFTENIKGYHLAVEDLSTIIRHANMANEWPALVVAFSKLNRKFAVLPYEVFLELVEKIRGK